MTTKSLEGRVAVVTGGSYGIGRGIAEAMLAAGASVLLSARSERVMEAAKELANGGSPVAAHLCDVREPDQAAALMDAAIERFGNLDIVVNNAAAPRSAKLLLDLEVADWDDHLRTNVTGTFVCVQAAAERLVDAGRGGRVINLSSMAAARPMLRRAHYNASKAGIEALTRSAAVELAAHAITVNAIAPGMIETETSKAMRSGSLSGADAEYLRDLRARIPAGRMGSVDEIAAVAVFLASPAASYVTGQVLTVDGAITV